MKNWFFIIAVVVGLSAVPKSAIAQDQFYTCAGSIGMNQFFGQFGIVHEGENTFMVLIGTTIFEGKSDNLEMKLPVTFKDQNTIGSIATKLDDYRVGQEITFFDQDNMELLFVKTDIDLLALQADGNINVKGKGDRLLSCYIE